MNALFILLSTFVPNPAASISTSHRMV